MKGQEGSAGEHMFTLYGELSQYRIRRPVNLYALAWQCFPPAGVQLAGGGRSAGE
jgi:hypothetical protein